jgi:hypothetical protein
MTNPNKLTKRQAGRLGGLAGKGKSKKRGPAEYYRDLRAGKKLTPAAVEDAIKHAKANDLPILDTANPDAPLPSGFTHRPYWQT